MIILSSRWRLFHGEHNKWGSSEVRLSKTLRVGLDCVTIHDTPSCGCMFVVLNKGQQSCKHLIIVLLSLRDYINDPLLFQIAYTESELSSLLSSEFWFYRNPPVLRHPQKNSVKSYIWLFMKRVTSQVEDPNVQHAKSPSRMVCNFYCNNLFVNKIRTK